MEVSNYVWGCHMIYLTGDTHGEFLRFNGSSFPEQSQMTKKDVVIICGDFGGIWRAGPNEDYWLDWLDQQKPFQLLWVDGNHENFSRLNSDEFPIVDLYSGKAQQIRPSIYRLLRGEVYEIQGKRFFTFGGARSHDIDDGILEPDDYDDPLEFQSVYRRWRMEGRMFRVKGVSWWPEELPSETEMEKGRRSLEAVNYEVDYVVTHCLPHDVASVLSHCTFYPDRLTLYLNGILHQLRFYRWYCGHYRTDQTVMGKFQVLYRNIERIL